MEKSNQGQADVFKEALQGQMQHVTELKGLNESHRLEIEKLKSQIVEDRC